MFGRIMKLDQTKVEEIKAVLNCSSAIVKAQNYADHVKYLLAYLEYTEEELLKIPNKEAHISEEILFEDLLNVLDSHFHEKLIDRFTPRA